MRDVGLYRILPGAEILESYYDWDTHFIGLLNFIPAYDYSDYCHKEKAIPSERNLWKAMFKYKDALAVFFTNNTYVTVVTATRIIYINAYNESDTREFFFSEPVFSLRGINIGYVKTRPKCLTVPVLPYRLYYFPKMDGVFIRGTFQKIAEKPNKCDSLKPYFDLIQNDSAEAIYVTQSGKNKFIC